MKRRILSLLLALCLIVGLLPNVALSAFAAVTTRTIQAMKGTDYEMTLTATSDGETVSYTKNQEITLEETNEDGTPKTEWVQVPADETDWNAKYYYNAETGRFTLEMKGVKVTKSCRRSREPSRVTCICSICCSAWFESEVKVCKV